MKHYGKRLLAAGLSAAMVLGSVGAVGATTVSDIDCTGWWVAFSDGIALEDGDSVEITFTNTTYSEDDTTYYTWNAPLYVVYSGTDTINGDGYAEYWVERSDAYGWAGTSNTSTKTSWIQSTDAWIEANQAGLDYTVTASRSGDDVTVFIVDGTGASSYFTSTVSDDVAYLALTGEACTLSNIYVDDKYLGDLDCASWWSAFSDGIALEDGDSVEITFTNTTYNEDDKTYYTWNAPLYVLYSGSETVNGDGYKEYWVERSDLFGWAGTSNTSTTTSWIQSTDTWIEANQAGLDYTVTASRSENDVTVTIMDATGAWSYFTTTVGDGVAYLALTGELCTLSNIEYAYEADPSTVEFLGGSLKMTSSDDYSTTGLRFGYTVELPDGATNIKATWNWGTDADNLTAFTPSTLNYVDNEDGTITTNLVITDIPSASYATTIYSELVLTYELDGVTYTVTDSVQSRSVDSVATAISTSVSASTTEQEYAAGILAN